MEKIKLKVTKKVVEEKEVEFGEKGDFVLIKSKAKENSYRLGKLEGIEEDRNKNPFLEFQGQTSYRLRPRNIFGSSISNIEEIPENRRSQVNRYFDIRRIEEAIVGKDNIVKYLESKAPEEYKPYAEIIKNMK